MTTVAHYTMSAPRATAPVERPTAPRVQILGIRGVPNRHGGFEAFAEDLSRHLVAAGWEVTVYCQEEFPGHGESPESPWETRWEGVRRVHVPVRQAGALGTIVFDWRCTRLATADPEAGLPLVLGYNTGAFCAAYRLRGRPCVLNMDGLEWKRAKYPLASRIWLYLNEWLGCLIANHLVADHPEVARHLVRHGFARNRVTTIPYGARRVQGVATEPLAAFGLKPDRFAVLIARPEPENSILQMVRAWSSRPRQMPLVVLGGYAHDVEYQRLVLQAAGPDVFFVGAIYDAPVVDALRSHARFYVHGHTVGGTNPSLVQALGAGTPVLAHDNPYNRWVCGPAAGRFFVDEESCAAAMDMLLSPESDDVRAAMRAAAWRRHAEAFTLAHTLGAYEALLRRWVSLAHTVAAREQPA